MDYDYWKKQPATQPLYPDIEWNKPERRDQAGRLGIIGGNKLGFAAAAEAYQTALDTGAGSVRVLLPDALRLVMPPTISDTVYAPTTPSGSLSGDAASELRALGEWANQLLFIGDAGRNAETAVLYEQFIAAYHGPLTITRDAVDLVKNSSHLLVERPDTLLVVAFAQLQKLFQAVYYPKMLTYSMQLLQLVEALHKFTTTYPVTIITLHKDTLIVAHGGSIITQEWQQPMAIWRGSVATRAACYWLWTPSKPFEAVATSIA